MTLEQNPESSKSSTIKGIFDGVEYIGATIAMLACFALLGIYVGLGESWPWLGLILIIGYPLGIILIAISKTGRSGLSWRHPVRFLLLLILYVISGFWDLITIFLILPAVIIDMLLGPFMFVLLAVSGVLTGEYYFDIIFTSKPFIWKDFGYSILGLLVFMGSILILRWRLSTDPDTIMDKGNEMIFWLRDKIQQGKTWCTTFEKN